MTRPVAALGALLAALLAGGAAAGLRADRTTASAHPASTSAAGTLEVLSAREGSAVLEADGLQAGGAPAAGTIDVENRGTASGDFTLSATAPVDSDEDNPLSARLHLTVVDCGAFSSATAPTCGDGGDVVKYDGRLAQLGMPRHEVAPLGGFAAGERHRYELAVALDGSAGDAYEDGSTSVQLDFNAR